MNRPTKATTSGQAFLALRSKALSAGRTTAEYLRLYALEGFLLRLANSSHKNRFVTATRRSDSRDGHRGGPSYN